MFDANGNPIMAHPTFPDIGAPAELADGAAPAGEEGGDPGAAAGGPDDIAAIREELARLQGRYEALVSTRATPTTPTAPVAPAAPPKLDLSGLPDPVQDLAAYTTQLQERIDQYVTQRETNVMQQARTEVNTTASRAEAVQKFETTFASQEYADLANKPLLMQTALAAEARELRARGVDVMHLLQTSPKVVTDGVANRMRRELGATTPAAPAAPANRTGGVRAGSTAARPGAPQTPAKPVGFVDQMKQAQAASGLL